MVRMGHDSSAAALIYQHSSRASDEAIAAVLDAQLTARIQAAETDSRDGSGAHVGPRRRPVNSTGSDRRALTRCIVLERTTGIEPAFSAWEMPRAPGQQAG